MTPDTFWPVIEKGLVVWLVLLSACLYLTRKHDPVDEQAGVKIGEDLE